MRHSKLYLAIDLHARNCVIGAMTTEGRYLGDERFETTAANLIEHVRKRRSKEKILTFEEGPMAQWVADTLRSHVTRVLVCDPTENALIARSYKKKDEFDVHQLCRLLRLGELKEVYHSEDQDRVLFKRAVQNYLELRDETIRRRNRLRASFRGFGVQQLDGTRVYGHERDRYLARLPGSAQRQILNTHYAMLDAVVEQRGLALKRVAELGKAYPEIAEFLKICGVGRVGAHVFSAFVMTPHRFATARKLWRYSRLAITDRSSDGKPLGYQRLDPKGNSELKILSYHAWRAAVAVPGTNEVKEFFRAVLERTADRKHARLTTQRKILAVMWTIWKRNEAYDMEAFHRPSPEPEEA